MIKYFLTNKYKNIVEISEFSKNCWIYVIDPTEEEIEQLSQKFKISKESIKDGTDIYETPRIEDDEQINIFLRVPTSKIPQEPTSSFMLVLGKDYFITISKYELEIFERIKISKEFLTSNTTNCLLKILLTVSRIFEKSVREVIKNVKVDRRNISRLTEKDILNLILQEDILNDYLSSFNSIIDIYNKMLKIKLIKFIEKDKELLQDTIIDLNQTLNTCKAALKNISNMRNYYSTSLSNNLNKIITLLTIFTIFLAIPTLISGIYGMNIFLPLQNSQNAFWIILIEIISIWAVLFLLFRKFKII